MDAIFLLIWHPYSSTADPEDFPKKTFLINVQSVCTPMFQHFCTLERFNAWLYDFPGLLLCTFSLKRHIIVESYLVTLGMHTQTSCSPPIFIQSDQRNGCMTTTKLISTQEGSSLVYGRSIFSISERHCNSNQEDVAFSLLQQQCFRIILNSLAAQTLILKMMRTHMFPWLKQPVTEMDSITEMLLLCSTHNNVSIYHGLVTKVCILKMHIIN